MAPPDSSAVTVATAQAATAIPPTIISDALQRELARMGGLAARARGLSIAGVRDPEQQKTISEARMAVVRAFFKVGQQLEQAKAARSALSSDAAYAGCSGLTEAKTGLRKAARELGIGKKEFADVVKRTLQPEEKEYCQRVVATFNLISNAADEPEFGEAPGSLPGAQ